MEAMSLPGVLSLLCVFPLVSVGTPSVLVVLELWVVCFLLGWLVWARVHESIRTRSIAAKLWIVRSVLRVTVVLSPSVFSPFSLFVCLWSWKRRACMAGESVERAGCSLVVVFWLAQSIVAMRCCCLA